MRCVGTDFLANNSLEHVIICNEAALYRHVKSFVVYYHASRTHLALARKHRRLARCSRWNTDPSLRYRKLVVFTHRYGRRAA